MARNSDTPTIKTLECVQRWPVRRSYSRAAASYFWNVGCHNFRLYLVFYVDMYLRSICGRCMEEGAFFASTFSGQYRLN